MSLIDLVNLLYFTEGFSYFKWWLEALCYSSLSDFFVLVGLFQLLLSGSVHFLCKFSLQCSSSCSLTWYQMERGEAFRVIFFFFFLIFKNSFEEVILQKLDYKLIQISSLLSSFQIVCIFPKPFIAFATVNRHDGFSC